MRSLRQRSRDLWQAAREFFYGLTAYEFVQHAVRVRSDMETLFILVTLGDMIGVPVMPPFYSMRLLPYVAPSVATWKRRVLRERDHVVENEELHIIEM